MPTRLKKQDDRDLDQREVQQRAEVERDDDADEDLEDQQELALLDEVGLAGLVDELGDLEHRLMDRQVLELRADHEAEQEAQGADDQAAQQQRVAVDPLERHLPRSGRIRLASPPCAAPVPPLRACAPALRRRRTRRAPHDRADQRAPATLHAFLSPSLIDSCLSLTRLTSARSGQRGLRRNRAIVTDRGSGSLVRPHAHPRRAAPCRPSGTPAALLRPSVRKRRPVARGQTRMSPR